MKNKNVIVLLILAFIIVLSGGIVFAEDSDNLYVVADGQSSGELPTTNHGTVSGDVDVVCVNTGTTSANLTYDIPSNAHNIKSAEVYVNIYSGSAADTYGLNSNISIKTDNGYQNTTEELCMQSSTDGTVYNVNNHTTKCYSDFMIYYNITGLVQGLNGTSLSIDVKNFEMTGKQFDGRIKLLTLILAYDDGDGDVIDYWINSGQAWSSSQTTALFNTNELKNIFNATLTSIVLSSSEASYKLNNEYLTDADLHVDGWMYKYNRWDVTDKLTNGQNTEFISINNGASVKNVLSILKVQELFATVTLATEYTNTCYAGTNNTLTVTVNTNKNGKYTVRLLDGGVEVNSSEVNLVEGNNILLLTDSTIRTVDESTVNGEYNNKVNYTVEILLDDKLINNSSIIVPVLYNGYLGKNLAYPTGGFEPFFNGTITGDIVIEIKDGNSYLDSNTLSRTDVWSVNLGNNDSIVKAFIYVPYNWFNPTKGDENECMFNVTFNGNILSPIGFYRDQSNLGSYGKYGYGLLVYDASDCFNKSGDNTFVLNKSMTTPAVYPSTLIYIYNSTDNMDIKEIYISGGADLLIGSSYNKANRTVKADSKIELDAGLISDATLYIFAAGAQNGESNIVFNGNVYENVWNGTSYTTDLFTLNIKDSLRDINNVSFVATGSTILALHQIIVVNKTSNPSISLASEYTNTCYAGTNNTITITVDTVKIGKFTLELYADGVKVNESEIDLTYGTNKILLTDYTIRAINESTVNGMLNDKVNYTAKLLDGEDIIANSSVSIPILYNGNLGKNLAYPTGGFEQFFNGVITGDIVICTKGAESYMGGSLLNRTDIWDVSLPKYSNFVKAFIYVPYNWFNPNLINEDMQMFNITFNNIKITPVAMYRDQSNLGVYGRYGYGLLVYDVSDLIKTGENTFMLNKLANTPAVYPSTLIYLYNTTASGIIKNIYMSNGADLLAASYNDANRSVNTDSIINISGADFNTADLYIFAAGAQNGESNIVFNGNVYENVWNGTSSTTELFKTSITNTIKNTNNISFIATGSTILALQQIIVTSKNIKIQTIITPNAISTTYDSGKKFTIKVTDANKNPLSSIRLSLKIYTGNKYMTKYITTNSKGIATFNLASNLNIGNHKVEITSNNAKYNISKTFSSIKVLKAKTIIKAPKITAKVKKSKLFKVTVKNKANNNIVAGIKIKVKIFSSKKSKTYIIKTNKKGLAQLNIKKLKIGKYKVVISSGDLKYNINAKSSIVIK